MANIDNNYSRNVQGIRNTFKLFFDENESEQPPISSLSFHLALAMMQLSKIESKKYKGAMTFMESIVDLNPGNAGEWLGDLAWDMLENYFSEDVPQYKAVISAIHKRFEIPYNDLKLGNDNEVASFLKQFNNYF